MMTYHGAALGFQSEWIFLKLNLIWCIAGTIPLGLTLNTFLFRLSGTEQRPDGIAYPMYSQTDDLKTPID